MKKALTHILIITLASCSTKLIPLNDTFSTKEFGIYISFDEQIDNDLQMEIKRSIDDYIVKYNYYNNPLTLKLRDEDCSECFYLHIKNTKFVKSSQQGTAVLLNIIGLVALPVALGAAESPIILFFWYFPKTTSEVELTIPEQISSSMENQPILLYPHNSGFLRSREKQIVKHSKRLVKFLDEIVEMVEKQYYKNTRSVH